MKRNLFKAFTAGIIVFCMVFMAACEEDTVSEKTDNPQSKSVSIGETENSEPVSSENDTSSASSEKESKIIEKISGAADKKGIYGIIITLSDNVPDKGTVEMVYYGPKGTPQENSVVNTFRIEYYKEDAGTFEVHTFYDGEVYQNYHRQSKVKVTNTFGADVRARNVIIYYTPDGGQKEKIYEADAQQFYAS